MTNEWNTILFDNNAMGVNYGDTSLSTILGSVSLGFNFPYFGQTITGLSIYPDGDIYLLQSGSSNTNGYQVAVYHITAGYSGPFLYRSETSTFELNKLSVRIRQATGSTFTATNAFVITWDKNPNPVNATLLNSFQIVLVTDGFYSFLIFNFNRLDQTPGSTYFKDANLTVRSVSSSTTGSNCNFPGRLIFRVDGGELKINFSSFVYTF